MDPLSLFFLGCALFSGAFLIISTVLGAGGSHFGHLDGHVGGHDFHIGHAAHAGDFGHGDVGHAAHVGHGDASAAHATHADGTSAQTGATPTILSSVQNTLLGALNLYGLLMFLLIFGLVGYVAHQVLGWGVLFVILVPLLIGGAFAIGLTTLLHLLFATSAETVLTADDARLEGRLGTVTLPIRAGGIGEIIFTRKGGGRQSIGARSASGEALPAGAEVVVLDSQDGIASVQTWDTFLASARAGVMPELAPIEVESPRLPQPERPREG